MKRSLLALLGFLAGCAGPAPTVPIPADPPNILWILTEDISPAFGCYGDSFATTPNIDRLAREGILYRNAFATAPICSPSRSCLITGLYATSMGTQHLRCEVTLPESLKPFPHYLRERGYFCTNRNKTDYNFSPQGIWDHWSASTTPWRERKDDRPFFSMINIGSTHEGPTNLEDRYLRATKDLPAELRHDPAKAVVPPFYPDTPEIRKIFARLADLITAMDREVGAVLEELRKDGLAEDTIVFFFSDHGHGLPRYKRWLNDSGLRVPLVIRVPDKYLGLAENGPGGQTDRMVSFVDFAPTVLSLAGLPVPGHMQGRPFLGEGRAPHRRVIFGARSRADDMYECSRAVHDGRYLYVRHFMPHLPYIQPGFIYSDRKWSFRELRKLRRAGKLEGPPAALWAPRKPTEELYDLKNDPHELTNLAGSREHAAVKARLKRTLFDWILEHGDTGLLPEADYQIRSLGESPYDLVRDATRCDLRAVLAAAERVGDRRVPVAGLIRGLGHAESGVRYWSAVALLARERGAPEAEGALVKALSDGSPSVRIAAAEALCARGKTGKALPVLGALVDDERVWVALQASRALVFLGDRAKPLVPVMRKVVDKNRSAPGSRRPWKDFNYAAFTTWALEAALQNCGVKTGSGR